MPTPLRACSSTPHRRTGALQVKSRAGGSCSGAAHRVGARGALTRRRCGANYGFKPSAIRARCAALRSIGCVSRTVSRTTHLNRSGLSPRYAAGLSLFRPFSLGYFSFGPAKEK